MLTPYYEEPENGIVIYHGDCREILPHLPPVDLVLTDPPYSTPVMTSFGRDVERNYGDLSVQKFYLQTLERDLAPLVRGSVVIHCDDAYAGLIYSCFYHWHSCQYLVWDKGKIGMGKPSRRQHELAIFASKAGNLSFYDGKTRTTITRAKVVPPEHRLHGAQKPLEIEQGFIAGLTPADGTVLDPFMGSGTTLVAAKQLHRRAIGIEIEEKYCRIAVDRLRQEVLPC